MTASERARALTSIAEFLDDPLDRAGVEEILDVTRSLRN
jgi:hypothetical protein